MSASRQFPVRAPHPIADAIEILLERGAFGPYESRNALAVGLLIYAAIFPRVHDLTAGIADLPTRDRNKVHDFILRAVRDGLDLASLLPKPATAADLLALAKRH